MKFSTNDNNVFFLKPCSHVRIFSPTPIFQNIDPFVHINIYLHPFIPIFYSPIQNNIGPIFLNIGVGLNIRTCEQGLRRNYLSLYKFSLLCKQFQISTRKQRGGEEGMAANTFEQFSLNKTLMIEKTLWCVHTALHRDRDVIIVSNWVEV